MAKDFIPYDEQLKDQRWLWVRQVVMDRDFRSCRKCFRIHNLQVHHLEYKPGLKAWEYPYEYLITLCSRCHAIEHGILSELDYVKRPVGESRPVLSIGEVMIQIVDSVCETIRRRHGK